MYRINNIQLQHAYRVNVSDGYRSRQRSVFLEGMYIFIIFLCMYVFTYICIHISIYTVFVQIAHVLGELMDMIKENGKRDIQGNNAFGYSNKK